MLCLILFNDTNQLITKICAPNAILLGYGYCRNHMNKHKSNIPYYLIEIIVGFLNINFDDLHNLLIQ